MNRAKPCLMLHTKSQFHRPSGSGADFKGCLPYMALAASLVMSCEAFFKKKKAATGQLLILPIMKYITR